MATRRVRSVTNNEDVQTLKEGASEEYLINRGSEDWQMLWNLSRKPPYYRVLLDGLHEQTTDSLSLIAYLMKNDRNQVRSDECEFKVYLVDEDDWSETLIDTLSGVSTDDGKTFQLDILYTDLPVELDGEPLFLVKASLEHYGKKLYTRKYIHNIGIFDTVERLRRRINNHEALTTDNRDSLILKIS